MKLLNETFRGAKTCKCEKHKYLCWRFVVVAALSVFSYVVAARLVIVYRNSNENKLIGREPELSCVVLSRAERNE